MERWTMRELKEIDDITFAIQILHERRRTLTPYSPLGMKLAEAAHTLANIKEERDGYLARISAADGKEDVQEGIEDSTDLSACSAGIKAQILDNAEKLDEKCRHCNPDYKQCDNCECGGAKNAS